MKKIFKIFLAIIFLSSFALTPISNLVGVIDKACLPTFNPQIDTQMQEIMEQNYIPSAATAVIRNNSVIWAKGWGEQQESHLIYMTGSVTKTITGTAILKLYEDGLIDLDVDIDTYLPFSLRHPNFTWIPITIRMLLTHYAGLSKDTEMYRYGTMEDALQRLGWENPLDWLPYPFWIEEHLTPNGSLYDSSAWSIYKPGLTRIYSNFGYNVLGYILHCVTGQPIWEYVQENIFDPLQMDSTGYNFSKFDESQLAIPHEYLFELDPESTGNKAYPHYNFLAYSSGAVRSNIYDLARYLLIHMHNGISNGTQILNETTMETLHQLRGPFLEPGDEWLNWGGWGGTEGDIYGFHAKVYCYYEGNTTAPYGVITLVNQGMDDARDACFEITMLLEQYVHKYDILECRNTNGFTVYISITAIMLIVILFRRKKRK